jgi:hypothetical protein
MRRSFQAAIAILVLAFTHVSWAQDEQVAKLKEEGTAAFMQKDWTTALQKFEQAYALSKDPTFLFNQARTLESAQDLPRALDTIEEFQKLASPELKAKVVGLDDIAKGIRNRVATLVVRTNVAGAEIRINDRVAPKKTSLPETPVRVTREPVRLALVMENYFPCNLSINDLQASETRVVTCELASRSTRGVLSVNSTPGATLSVDGAPHGMVPFESDLTAGTHPIEISKEGFETYKSSVVVRVGEKTSLSHELSNTPGITSRWWFWTGIGVVAVGATVTVIALSTERSPDRGTIDPGTVRTGLRF